MKKSIFHLTSIFLALLFILQTIPLNLLAEKLRENDASTAETATNRDDEAKTETSENTEPYVLNELKDRREPNKKTFRMSDGSFQEAIYPYDVHYEDENGALIDIDNTLLNGVSDNEDVLVNQANASTVRFFKKSSSGKFYTLENDKNKVTVSIDGAEKVDATFTNTADSSESPLALTNLAGRVCYAEIFPNVDLEYTLISKRIKENVVIKKKDALSSLTYTYSFNGGVTAKQENAREISVYDKQSENMLFVITAPALWDSAGNYSEDLTLTLVEEKNSKLTVRLDFTIGEEMVYPVTVDPILKFQAEKNDIQDTHIIKKYPGRNYNINNHIRVRNDGYSLLQFPTPTLRPGDKIVKAEFALFPYGYFDSSLSIYSNANSFNPPLNITAHKILREWEESTATYTKVEPDNNFYEPIAQSFHVVKSNSEFYSWDITRLANEWTEGFAENYGVLLKYAAPPSNGSLFDSFFCSKDGTFIRPSVWPQIIYSYINTVGVEDYFSYHTQDLGFSGEGYVNDLTGNLTVTRELVSTGGNVAPISLSLIYNTTNAVGDNATSAPYGTGWKLNLAQKCVLIVPSGSENSYVQYTDADGTHHFFKEDENGVWTDEINPDRKIYVNNDQYEMKDSSGTTMFFSKNGTLDEWYLVKVEDIYGNNIEIELYSSNRNQVNSVKSSNGAEVWLNYSESGFLTSVRYMDGATQKTVQINYNTQMPSNNTGVSKIIFADSSEARYQYCEASNLLSSALNLDNSYIQYDYHNSTNRVSSIREVSSTGTEGNEFTFSYEPTATTITDELLERTYLYTFAQNGTLKSTVDITAEDGNGCGQYYEYNAGNTDTTGMGNLTFASKTQKNTVNLLTNHSFESDGQINSEATGTDSASASFGFSSEIARLGQRSYKMTAPSSGDYSELLAYYSVSADVAEQYTLSAYINTKDMVRTSGGARLIAIVDNVRYYSEYITESKNEWQRLSVSFPLTQAQEIDLCISLQGSTGSIYIDNMQLETGGLSDYNLLENAGFELGAEQPDSWQGTFDCGAFDSGKKASGERSYAFTVNPNISADLIQCVSVPSGQKGDAYVASAFAQAISVEPTEDQFCILVRFLKDDEVVNEKTIPFNYHTTGWQKVSGAVKAEDDYDTIRFGLLYYKNVNQVYFDNAQLIRDTFGNSYTYDSKGNLISTVDLQEKEENTFSYDGNNQLIRQSNIEGGEVLYSYDATKKTQLEQVTAGGNTTSYTYDEFGNVESSITQGNVLTPGSYYYLQNVNDSEFVNAAEDDEIKFTPFAKSASQRWKLIQNEDGSYSFESESVSGKHLTVTTLEDSGNVVLQTAGQSAYQKFVLEKIYGNIYFLKLQSNSAFSLDGNGDDCYIYSTNGARSQQFALLPVGSGTAEHPALYSSAEYSENGAYMTTLTDSRGNSVEYEYNPDRGYVTRETDPKGNTTSYTYTSGEQLSSVTSGGSTVSYSYNSAKQLSTITTPNGSIYGITYDAFGRKSQVKVGSQSLATYTYTNLGQTETVTYGNGTVTRYVYDDLGRLTETILNDVPQTRYVYDGSSRIHEQYDLVGNRKVKFEYDILGREVKRSLYNTANGACLSVTSTRYDDTKNRIAGYEVEAVGVTTSYNYLYGENGSAPETVTSVKIGDTKIIENEYDALNRLASRTLNTTTPIETTYSYLPGSDPTKTTTLVGSMQNGNDTFDYSYDENGNITSISKNNAVVESYTYDAKNQLLSVTRGSDVWNYSYDSNGNILSVNKNGASEKSYSYTDTNWKDKMTAFNGSTITYDAIGNPLQYRDGITFTWANGRKLSSVAKNGSTIISFYYDGEGNRIRKQQTQTVVDYVVVDGVIYAESRQAYVTNNLHYLFDENGNRFGFVHNSTDTYYYRFNLQGDVTGIYNKNGSLIVEYTYDAWGKLESTTGNTFIGLLNPIRYRGYYYDFETGLYYLQTRYYDPETGRFINADGLLSTGQGVLGYNMYAYCGNNPVNFSDYTGCCPHNGRYVEVYSASCIECNRGPNNRGLYSYVGSNATALAIINGNIESLIVLSKTKPNFTPTRNKRHGSEKRQPSGNRERNVGHPKGEEHSRVAKGNRGVKRFEAAVTFTVVTVAIVYVAANDSTIVGAIDDGIIVPLAKIWWDSGAILVS